MLLLARVDDGRLGVVAAVALERELLTHGVRNHVFDHVRVDLRLDLVYHVDQHHFLARGVGVVGVQILLVGRLIIPFIIVVALLRRRLLLLLMLFLLLRR